MALLKDEDRNFLETEFGKMNDNVKLVFVSSENNCQFCTEIGDLLDEVGSTSDKLAIETLSLENDAERVAGYGIDKAPAIVVTDSEGRSSGVHFFGVPSGYEFGSLITSIIKEGTNTSDLSAETQEIAKGIDKPVHIQVFVTPSCPHCPGAVVMGHQLARLNPNIRADMVEATEFPDLAQKYGVRGVPRVVINETTHFEGAQPEQAYMKHLLDAVNAN